MAFLSLKTDTPRYRGLVLGRTHIHYSDGVKVTETNGLHDDLYTGKR